MRYLRVVGLVMMAALALPAAAQLKTSMTPAEVAALEKELYEVELKWMKAEFDKRVEGPDSMGELWMDDFFDVLSSGQVVDKQQMMDQMVKSPIRKPGTGAFPRDLKLRAIHGNVALCTDHTTIKGLDANGNIVPVREMSVLRMFVKDNGKWRVAGAGLVGIPPATPPAGR